MMMSGIDHAFNVGAEVEVLADRTRLKGDVYQRAIIQRLEPYRGRPGYYVSYPDAKEQYECHGGWMPQHLVRTKEIP
jgi:hypothetical protein